VVITSPEHALSIRLHVKPVSENKRATLSVQVSQRLPAQLLERVRVTLRDPQQRLLVSQLTAGDGKVNFSNLATGLYWVEVKHPTAPWQQPILLTLDHTAPTTP
jgi:hypothetical protein